jgi:hypothetical protein
MSIALLKSAKTTMAIALVVLCILGALVFFLSRVTGEIVLDRNTVKKLLPDGMREGDVIRLLGTNMIVNTRHHGTKRLEYLFPFLGYPPKIQTRIDNVVVVISNEVVIDRWVKDTTWSH